MNTTQIIRDAIKAFPKTELSDVRTIRHNRMAYIRARMSLGDRWILASKVAHKHRDAVVAGVTLTLAPAAVLAHLFGGVAA